MCVELGGSGRPPALNASVRMDVLRPPLDTGSGRPPALNASVRVDMLRPESWVLNASVRMGMLSPGGLADPPLSAHIRHIL